MVNSDKTVAKFSNDDLNEMQNWDLDRKIQVSKARIIEFAEKFDNKIYVSFSGGKDSTVLLHLVRSIYPNAIAVFVDTGLEYPELRNFVKTIKNVIWLKPKMNFKKVIEIYGYPIVSKEVSRVIHDAKTAIAKGNSNSYAIRQLEGKYISPHTGKISPYNKSKWKFLLDAPFPISNRCCDVMKKQTVHQYEKESGNKPIIGTMASESRLRRSQWIINGCNAFNAKNPSSKPLSFWTEQDVLKYIKINNLNYAPIYGDIVLDENGKYSTTGANRTGCVFCAYGVQCEKEPNRFQKLKETHPKLWNYCMRPSSEGGLNMREVLDYIGVKVE